MNILGLAAGPCGIKDIEQLRRNLRGKMLGLNEAMSLVHGALSNRRK
jgi:hypothetical protein